MSDWWFLAGCAIALLIICTLGVDRQHNPSRRRRGQQPAAGRPDPPKPSTSLPTKPPRR